MEGKEEEEGGDSREKKERRQPVEKPERSKESSYKRQRAKRLSFTDLLVSNLAVLINQVIWLHHRHSF